MYSETLKLAFEFDGSQHDVFSPHYHRNEDHFQYRRLLDRLKTELCREAGVLLVRIPWHEVSLSDQVKTARYLERLLASHHIPFVPGAPRAARPATKSLLRAKSSAAS